jgi:actin-related protein 2
MEAAGISDLLFQSIQSAPIDIRSDLYRHIVLSGGSTMYPGLPTRIERDLESLQMAGRTSKGGVAKADDPESPARLKVKVEDPPERKHIVFLGGAVLADLMKDNDAFWIRRSDWDEQGPACLDSILRR